jgi:hypothetical protein
VIRLPTLSFIYQFRLISQIDFNPPIFGECLALKVPSGCSLDLIPTSTSPSGGFECYVYVNINNSHRVMKYSSVGEMLDGWTVEGEMTGIAVGPNGLVYVSSTNGLIQVFAA